MSGGRAALLAAMVAAAGCSGARGPVEPLPFPGAGSATTRRIDSPATAKALTARALDLVGTPYRLGGERPAEGLDCSGLVRFVFLGAGRHLPRTVAEQVAIGSTVAPENIEAGDLVFFDTIAEPHRRTSGLPEGRSSSERPDPGAAPTHVGIALDADAFVHAPGSGGTVRVDRLSAPYWRPRLVAVRRIQ